MTMTASVLSSNQTAVAGKDRQIHAGAVTSQINGGKT